jgi:hypothetical protein
MATTVHELTGSMSNIARDSELIFPNIQTCVAVVAFGGGGLLVGAHMTIADRSRVEQVAVRVRAKCSSNPREIFVVGPSLATWSLNPFKNSGHATLKTLDASKLGFFDLRARLDGGTIEFGIQPNNSNQTQSQSNFQSISIHAFHKA